MNKEKIVAIFFAFAAAVLYAINIPVSKILLIEVEPVFLSSFLYLGAGAGIGLMYFFMKRKTDPGEKLTGKELPYTIGMIVLDIAAPIFLMIGLTKTTAANATLLSNFEIVATSVIALIVFKELITKRLWIAIIFITTASVLLTFESSGSFDFSYGSLFVCAACVCWGLENNCTRMLSSKNTYEIVMLKGFFSGMGSFIIALILGESIPAIFYVVCIMLLGFMSYGISIFLYVRAQNHLGAAKTSAYYAVAPFIGTVFSYGLLREKMTMSFFISLLIMIVGASLAVMDTLIRDHTHLHTHVILYTKDGEKQMRKIQHTHLHKHLLISENHNHKH